MSRKWVWPVIVAASVAVVTAMCAALAAARSAPVPRCTTDQLTITVHDAAGGLDHVGLAVRFRNRGPRCSLAGYPGLDEVSGTGRIVAVAKRTLKGYLGGADRVSTVTLTRGATASALLEGMQPGIPGVACRRYRSWRITPPDDRRSVEVSTGKLGALRPPCEPQIHPLLPGLWGGAVR